MAESIGAGNVARSHRTWQPNSLIRQTGDNRPRSSRQPNQQTDRRATRPKFPAARVLRPGARICAVELTSKARSAQQGARRRRIPHAPAPLRPASRPGISGSSCVPDRPEPTSPPSPAPPPPSTPLPNLPPARHSARFPAFTPDRSPPAPSAGPRRQLPQPRYTSNCSTCRGGDRAAASSGTSADSSSDPSTFRIDSGSWIAASNRLGPPHRGHTNTSIRNTRRSSSAHG
jgi:hypothetical protein